MTLTLNPYLSTKTYNPMKPAAYTLDLYIGGTLSVGTITNDPAGSYTGTFTVKYTLNNN